MCPPVGPGALQACLNGDRRGEAVPETPGALAREAAAVRVAGASDIHLHPRGGDGAETLAPEAVAAAVRAVRAAVPDIAVGIGSGAWIAPGGRARQRDLKAWDDRPDHLPDHVSVNLHEADAGEVIALLADKGVAVDAGLWSVEDVERLFVGGRDLAPFRMALVEVPDLPERAARDMAEAMLERLAEFANSLPVLLHGTGESTWPCVAMAFERGLATRIGFEDTPVLPDGRPAASNAALVEAAAGLR